MNPKKNPFDSIDTNLDDTITNLTGIPSERSSLVNSRQQESESLEVEYPSDPEYAPRPSQPQVYTYHNNAPQNQTQAPYRNQDPWAAYHHQHQNTLQSGTYNQPHYPLYYTNNFPQNTGQVPVYGHPTPLVYINTRLPVHQVQITQAPFANRVTFTNTIVSNKKKPIPWTCQSSCQLVCTNCNRHISTQTIRTTSFLFFFLFFLLGFIGIVLAFVLMARGHFTRYVHICPACKVDLTDKSNCC